jgi:hypothetical protein
MPSLNTIQEIILTAGGGTVNLPTLSPVTSYIIQGVATLTSNWTIQPSGTAFVGMQYIFKISKYSNINLNGNNLTVFSTGIDPLFLNGVGYEPMIVSTYTSTGWDTKIFRNDGIVPDSVGLTGFVLPQDYQTIFEDSNVTAGQLLEGSNYTVPILRSTDYDLVMGVEGYNLGIKYESGAVIKIKGKIKYFLNETNPLPGTVLGSGNWIFKAMSTDFLNVLPIFHFKSSAGYYTSNQTLGTLAKPNSIKSIDIYVGDPSGVDSTGGIWFEIAAADIGTSTTATYVVDVDITIQETI